MAQQQEGVTEANSVTPLPRDYIPSGRPDNNNNLLDDESVLGSIRNRDIDPGTLAYDPETKTLYVPKHISEALAIQVPIL